MKFNVTFMLCFIVSVILADTDDDAWQNYKAKFKKQYSPREEAQRKVNFLKTQQEIERHNKEKHTWKLGHNMFSDMTLEEKKQRLGLKIQNLSPKSNATARALVICVQYVGPMICNPEKLDYRQDGCLQPVKDQGSCGSCWAFAAITPLEFAYCKKTGTPVAFSEQQLVSCDPNDGGCGGGIQDRAWSYLQTTGIATSSAYPYVSGSTSTNGECYYTDDMSMTKTQSWDWGDPAGSDAVVVAHTLVEHGPLATSISVIDSFFSYSSGVYDDADCNNYGPSHAVVIVGYDTSDEGIPYWIVRNSWGIGWGDQGYIKMRRGANLCGIEYWSQRVTLA